MRIELQVGNTKTILLQKEGVGGYNWILQKPDEEAITVSTKQLPTNSKIIGGGAALQVSITALKKGMYFLVAEYRRSWEKQAAKVQQYEIVIS